jgi:phosphoribosylamine--glycine ligase
MGVYSPTPIITADIFDEIMGKIIYRTMTGLVKEGINYRGVLYAGIMLTQDGPKALEFNVRFGDPETEAILPRLKSDLVEVMMATSEGNLLKIKGLSWDDRVCVSVVCAAGGYPGNYAKDKEISGLEEVEKLEDVIVFHAGTKKVGNKILTNGGRVLVVTGLGVTIQEAIAKTYATVEKIKFEGMHYRRDIGKKAIDSN